MAKVFTQTQVPHTTKTIRVHISVTGKYELLIGKLVRICPSSTTTWQRIFRVQSTLTQSVLSNKLAHNAFIGIIRYNIKLAYDYRLRVTQLSRELRRG